MRTHSVQLALAIFAGGAVIHAMLWLLASYTSLSATKTHSQEDNNQATNTSHHLTPLLSFRFTATCRFLPREMLHTIHAATREGLMGESAQSDGLPLTFKQGTKKLWKEVRQMRIFCED
jgi:hypothetical protein